MRCKITKKSKIKKLSKLVGKEIKSVLVRGNTEHRIDILCIDGSDYSYFPKDKELYIEDKNDIGNLIFIKKEGT